MEPAASSSPSPLSPLRLLAAYAVTLAVVLLIRAPAFHWSELNPDEAINLLIGRSVLQGHLPYVQVWDHKPPLMYWTAAGAQVLFGQRPQAMAVLACVAIAVTATSLYCIGLRAFGDERRWAAGPAGIYILSSLSNNGLSAHTEHLVSAAVAAGAALVVKPGPGWGRYVAAGLIFGIGCQLKFLAAFEIAAIGLFVLLNEVSWKRGILAVALLAGMTLLPFVFTVAIYAAAHQLPLLIDTDFRYSAAYAAVVHFSASHLKQAAVEQFLAAPWLWVAAAGTLLWPRARGDDPRSFRLAALWAAAALASAISTKRFYSHYFLAVYPPLSLLAAMFLQRLVRSGIAGRLAAVLVVLTMLTEQTARLGQQWRNVFTKADNPAAVAAYVRGQLAPGQSFYLAGGSSVIYYLANVTPPTRYAFPQQISSTLWPRLPETDPAAELARVRARRPELVVLSLADQSAPDERVFITQLDAWLAREFQPPALVNGYAIYRRSPAPPS